MRTVIKFLNLSVPMYVCVHVCVRVYAYEHPVSFSWHKYLPADAENKLRDEKKQPFMLYSQSVLHLII